MIFIINWLNEAFMSEERESKPLNRFRRGDKVRVVDVNKGCCGRGKLFSLGVIPGTVVEVLSAGRWGPCRLRVRGTELALGRRLAGSVVACAMSPETECS